MAIAETDSRANDCRQAHCPKEEAMEKGKSPKAQSGKWASSQRLSNSGFGTACGSGPLRMLAGVCAGVSLQLFVAWRRRSD